MTELFLRVMVMLWKSSRLLVKTRTSWALLQNWAVLKRGRN